jgi:hypothetical protein
MTKILPGALAALLATAVLAAPAAAAPSNVTVRVEGAAQTVIPRSAVTTDTTPVLVEGSSSCSGTSAGGALYKAAAGDIGGTWGAFGFLLERVKGETQTAPPSSDPAPFWSFWVNYRFQDQGLCATELQEGDEVLVFADCFSATNQCSSLTPLRIRGVPATVAPGQSISVRLEEFTTQFNPSTGTTTTPEPAENATISAGGQTVATGADGTAQLTLSSPGPVSIEATKGGRVRTAALTCVTSGADGSCGSTLPPGAVLGTERAADRTAPRVSFARLKNGKVYKRKRAPRKLFGNVSADPSGLLSVRLSILRKVGDRCWAFDGDSERFERHRCGGRSSFKIGDRAEWSYLLPKRLGKGRYVIRAVAIDNAGNDSAERVVIRVR